jgi:hypothetical protein
MAAADLQPSGPTSTRRRRLRRRGVEVRPGSRTGGRRRIPRPGRHLPRVRCPMLAAWSHRHRGRNTESRRGGRIGPAVRQAGRNCAEPQRLRPGSGRAKSGAGAKGSSGEYGTRHDSRPGDIVGNPHRLPGRRPTSGLGTRPRTDPPGHEPSAMGCCAPRLCRLRSCTPRHRWLNASGCRLARPGDNFVLAALREAGELVAAALGHDKRGALRAAGAAMTTDEAISYALASIDG